VMVKVLKCTQTTLIGEEAEEVISGQLQ